MLDLDKLLIEDNSQNSFYKTSFFEIFLSCPFNKDLEILAQNKQNLGLFVHEYIHFLQNISTPWGLFSSMVRYEGVIETLNQLRKAKDIKIPFTTNFSLKHIKHNDTFKEGEGTSNFRDLYNKSVDVTKDIDIKSEKFDKNGQIVRRFVVCFTDNIGKRHEVHIGAKIIRESMAFMYQTLIDNNASTKHDVPYNIIKIICIDSFPNIYKDTVKLITLCHLSLYTMNPGQTLFDLLHYANNKPNIPSMQIVDYYMNNHTVKNGEQKSLSISELCDKLADDLIGILNNIVPSKLDFLKISIDAARLSTGFIPYLNVLYGTESLTVEHIEAMTSYLGIPYLTDLNHSLYYNNMEGKGMSNDLLFLKMISLVLEMLTINRDNSRCPSFKHECDGSVKDDNECLSFPWNGNKCAFTDALDYIGIDKNVIHW